jgi:hypothetical protein
MIFDSPLKISLEAYLKAIRKKIIAEILVNLFLKLTFASTIRLDHVLS